MIERGRSGSEFPCSSSAVEVSEFFGFTEPLFARGIRTVRLIDGFFTDPFRSLLLVSHGKPYLGMIGSLHFKSWTNVNL